MLASSQPSFPRRRESSIFCLQFQLVVPGKTLDSRLRGNDGSGHCVNWDTANCAHPTLLQEARGIEGLRDWGIEGLRN